MRRERHLELVARNEAQHCACRRDVLAAELADLAIGRLTAATGLQRGERKCVVGCATDRTHDGAARQRAGAIGIRTPPDHPVADACVLRSSFLDHLTSEVELLLVTLAVLRC